MAQEKREAQVLLDVKNLNVDYLAASGTVHAVTDVHFTLRRGEILGLAGESGSGKSTLAYAITRLLRPPALITGGEIWYYPHADATERVQPSHQEPPDAPSTNRRDALDRVHVQNLPSRQERGRRGGRDQARPYEALG